VKHGALVHDGTGLCELWHMHVSHLHYGTFPLLKDLV
jgi:hypothetical protein